MPENGVAKDKKSNKMQKGTAKYQSQFVIQNGKMKWFDVLLQWMPLWICKWNCNRRKCAENLTEKESSNNGFIVKKERLPNAKCIQTQMRSKKVTDAWTQKKETQP